MGKKGIHGTSDLLEMTDNDLDAFGLSIFEKRMFEKQKRKAEEEEEEEEEEEGPV